MDAPTQKTLQQYYQKAPVYNRVVHERARRHGVWSKGSIQIDALAKIIQGSSRIRLLRLGPFTAEFSDRGIRGNFFRVIGCRASRYRGTQRPRERAVTFPRLLLIAAILSRQ